MLREMGQGLKVNKLAFLALVVIFILSITAILAPLLSPYHPLSINLEEIKLSPSFKHPLGTDNKGRDILSRILYGARTSLFIGITTAICSMSIGLILGLLAGYLGGKIDLFLVFLIDLTLSFPSLLLAIGITVLLPPGAYTVLIALTLVGWASFARLIRGMVLSLKQALFVEVAYSVGCSPQRIILRHLLPNVLPLAIVVLSLRTGSFILAESALSFLGLGIQPPFPSWGAMISLNRIYIHSAPWMVLFPGLAITLTTMAFNILGDFLRDLFDPHLKI